MAIHLLQTPTPRPGAALEQSAPDQQGAGACRRSCSVGHAFHISDLPSRLHAHPHPCGRRRSDVRPFPANPMMRALICVLLLLPLFASADGLPYRTDGEIDGEWIILHIDDSQFQEVDTRRTLTLTKAQRALLTRLFKTVPETLTVVSSTFNDNREEASNAEVHCVWLRDRTLGITYDADYASRQPGHYWDHAFFTSTADPKRLVVSHDAKVYHEGRPLSLADVFRLIDELAKTPPGKGKADIRVTPQSRLQLVSPVASLGFSLPPPNKDALDLDVTPASLLEAFTVYGTARNVQVSSTW